MKKPAGTVGSSCQILPNTQPPRTCTLTTNLQNNQDIMPLPDERPRPSVANLIGKFETSQKRNPTSSPVGVAGAPGSTTAAPLARKPSIDTEGATSPRAIAQQLTGNDSSTNGTSASARKCGLSDKPTTPPTVQEDAGSGVPVSTPAPINGEDSAKYNDDTNLSLSDLKVPDVQEVPPTPLAEQTDALPAAGEPAPTASLEPAAPSKKAPASPKKPATSLAKPTMARFRPSSATSSTPKPSTAAAAVPRPKPTTGSMGKPPAAGAPRAPRPGSNANTRPTSTVRTTVSTPKPPVSKPSTAPKPASTTPATSSSIARRTPTGSGSTLTPGAAPAKKSSTSSLRPSATAVGSGTGGSAGLRRSVSGKPATSAASASTKPAPGTTSTVRRPATGATPSTTATGGAGSRGGVKPRVGLVGAARVKDPAAAGKATTSAATQKTGAPGGKGKTTAVVTKGTVAVAGVAVAVAAEEARPEGVIKAEDEREVPVQGSQDVSIEVSSEEPHEAPEEHHEAYVEVPASDVGSHEEGRSVPASPPIEGEELHYAEGSVREDEVTSPPPVFGSDQEHEHEHEHEHEQPGEEQHEPPQLSEEQQAELLKDDVPTLPEPSEQEVAEAAAIHGAEEHLEKVVPPYQPPVLPTGDQVDEEKLVEVGNT